MRKATRFRPTEKSKFKQKMQITKHILFGSSLSNNGLRNSAPIPNLQPLETEYMHTEYVQLDSQCQSKDIKD